MACTIHLVRHAQHGLLGHVLAGRMAGVELSAAGLAEAAALARHFTTIPARALLVSPLLRAEQTAAPVAAATGLSAVTDHAFTEVDFGAWTGQRFIDLEGAPRWRAWNTARGLAATPGGETMLAVQARVVAALAGQVALGGTIIVVSHADVIKAALTHALGMPLDLMHRLEIGPASRSTLVLGEDFARVEAVNQPP